MGNTCKIELYACFDLSVLAVFSLDFALHVHYLINGPNAPMS